MTRPALMQLVHALTRPGVPLTSARTRCTFGSHRRLFRLCENVTDLPNHGFLTQYGLVDAVLQGKNAGANAHGESLFLLGGTRFRLAKTPIKFKCIVSVVWMRAAHQISGPAIFACRWRHNAAD